MVDIVTVLSLQGRSRRNAKRAMGLLQRQRAERTEADKVLAGARAGARPASSGPPRPA